MFLEGSYAGLFKPLGFRALMSAGCDLVLAAKPGLDVRKPLRVATSFPLQTIAGFDRLGLELDIDRLDEWGGKIEGKIATGKYDAIVDLRSSGETLTDNGLVVYECLDSIQTGIVFRREAYNPIDYTYSPWRLFAEIQTIRNRKNQLDEGVTVDLGVKNTLSLLADRNKRDKALGEEAVELAVADALKEGIEDESADIDWLLKVVSIANGISPLRYINSALSRNKKPRLQLPGNKIQ